MKRWQKLFHLLIHRIETGYDSLRYALRRKYRGKQALRIVAYHGIGNRQILKLTGRVLEDNRQAQSDTGSLLDNIRNSYERFETDEVPGIGVRAEFQNSSQEVMTDEEGYFNFEIQSQEPLDEGQTWHSVRLNLVDTSLVCAAVEGRVMIASKQARFGIISDMDDTVLVTDATSPLRAMYLTFLTNVNARVPFSGVAAFYRALTNNAVCQNPLYYVSSSPWNLYEMLIAFMHRNAIPEGPLMLRDIGIDEDKFIASSHGSHKREQILKILALNPALEFILIGDSGQHDPEIYQQIALDYPDRIKVIYIRDVSVNKRDRAVREISTELASQAETMVFVPDTITAAEDAVSRGLIEASSLDSVRADAEISSHSGSGAVR